MFKLFLLSFLCLTVWIIIEFVKVFFGERIKEYIKRQLDIYKATKEYQEWQRARLLAWYKSQEIIEVEVEEVIEETKHFDVVKNGIRIPLEITNTKTLEVKN